MQNTEKKLSDLLKQDEFYLADLFKLINITIRRYKKIIFSIFILFTILFICDYNLSPVEYESKATVMVEQQVSASNNSLTSLLGLSNSSSNSSNSGILAPEMYTELFKSQVFLNEIIQSKIPISQESKDSISLEEFFSNGEILTFYQKLRKPTEFFNNKNPYSINRKTKSK